MTVAFANRQRTKKINLRLLKQIVEALLADSKITKVELEINLVAAPAITRLNGNFLHHKGPTDVIAFDYGNKTDPGGQRFVAAREYGAQTKECPPKIFGEIFICVDEAVLQAQKFGVSWQSEVVRYVVHGVLHLLGHDDLHVGARRKMKREENRLLRKLSHRFALSKL